MVTGDILLKNIIKYLINTFEELLNKNTRKKKISNHDFNILSHYFIYFLYFLHRLF